MAQTALLCGAVVALCGCAERKAHAFPWATAVLVRPNPPIVHADRITEAADLAPDIRIDPPTTLGRLFALRPAPARPRGSTGSQPDTSNGTKTPELVPQLGPQETAVAKVQFTESMAVVERNLAATRGKSLTAAQTDIVSKITGFIAEARGAGGEGDWGRARNLAKKAQILSEDLVGSL